MLKLWLCEVRDEASSSTAVEKGHSSPAPLCYAVTEWEWEYREKGSGRPDDLTRCGPAGA